MNTKDHPLYPTWKSIRQRVYDTNCKTYPHYGGRGITLAPEWAESSLGRNPSKGFMSFAAYVDTHLGPKPEGWSLDRIDNNRGYEPGNLRWADKSTQMKNRRKRGGYRGHTKQTLPWQSYRKDNNTYRSQFVLYGKRYSAGQYSTALEAHEASAKLREQLLGKLEVAG